MKPGPGHVEDLQKQLCRSYGAIWCAAPDHLKVGITPNVRSSIIPVNGLRSSLVGDTTGWYIWASEEAPTADGAFVPLHVAHLLDWRPEILKFLGLPPGWRFLTDGHYQDVWQDLTLLDDD